MLRFGICHVNRFKNTLYYPIFIVCDDGGYKATGLFEIILVYSFSGIPIYTHLSKQYFLFGITDPRPCAS